MSEPPDQPPDYRLYGSASSSPRRRRPRKDAPQQAPQQGDRPYTLYRSRPRGLLARLRGRDDEIGGLEVRSPRRDRGGAPLPGSRRWTWKRVLALVAAAIGAWLVLSIVLFIISASQDDVSQATKNALKSGGPLPFSANTVLVIGADQRPKGRQDCGSAGCPPPRSDTLLLLRVGGFTGRKLSIPRDLYVPIPGHGMSKINAAYAYGGPALTIKTLDQYLGIDINHVLILNFEGFRKFIDAIGGVDIKTGCLVDDINGGTKNGGVSLRLRPGTHHFNGKTALAYSRSRHNRCPGGAGALPDVSRVKHQQQVLSAVQGQLLSLGTFFRLPWVSWQAPKAFRTDMGGVGLMGLFSAMATGLGPTRVLGPLTPSVIGGQDVLSITDAAKRRAVQKFLNG